MKMGLAVPTAGHGAGTLSWLWKCLASCINADLAALPLDWLHGCWASCRYSIRRCTNSPKLGENKHWTRHTNAELVAGTVLDAGICGLVSRTMIRLWAAGCPNAELAAGTLS